MRSAKLAIVALVLLAAGCDRRSPEQIAQESGLMMPGPTARDGGTGAPSVPPESGSYLAELQAAAKLPMDKNLIKMPDPAPPIEVTMKRYAGSYPGWETDRIDASSFDALAASLNTIISKMPPGVGEDFDRVVKYVLMQITKDPLVAKKSVIGDRISDRELIGMIGSYLDGRTPAEVVTMAEQMRAREDRMNNGEQRPQPPPIQPMAMPEGL